MKPTVSVAADESPLILDTVSQDADLRNVAAQAAFMEQELEIEITAPATDNDPTVVILNVNSTNQPVMRGQPQKIKRKYVEVLARMKQTSYTQSATNYMNPEISNELRPRTAIVYPFQVLHDPHPKGGYWLRHILAEAA